jgi:hypothetical protein
MIGGAHLSLEHGFIAGKSAGNGESHTGLAGEK